MSIIPGDIVFLPETAPDQTTRWVAMNVFSRTSLGLSGDVFALLGRLGQPLAEDREATYTCWNIQWFSNEEGLLADPTRIRRRQDDWEEITLSYEDLLKKLKHHCIVIDDPDSYRQRFQPKKNLLDSVNFGNFHQQHGQHLMAVKRIDPAKWWREQKFTDDGLAVRSDTLYGAIQWRFLEKYFAKRIQPGMSVIDLGCGTGLYANLMAKQGAEVLGIDPSDDYLETARSIAVDGTRFEKMAIGEKGGLDTIPDNSADLIFMSDALLFYFVPFYPGQNADIEILLSDIRRILKPGGALVSLEPHSVFYLAPWLGEPNRPFTILTEYLNKWFGVVPSLSDLIGAFTKADFVVNNLEEIGPDDYFKKVDPRGFSFSKEFPLWHLLEFAPRSS